MADRPILFSAPMVRALLDGRKTQTRLVLKNQPETEAMAHPVYQEHFSALHVPYAPGDRLWVREAWQEFFEDEIPAGRSTQISGRMGIPAQPERRSVVVFRADGEMPDHPEHGRALWRPSIHMPRWASRLTLIVTDVRVERLQDISEADAVAEGVEDVTDQVAPRDPSLQFWRRYRDGGWNGYVDNPIASYASLWTKINGRVSWDENPWVCALTFDVRRGNIDQEMQK